MHNHLRTFMLLAGMTALFVGVGYLIGGATGMAVALAIGVAMNFFSYWNSDKIVLRMYGAREVDPSTSEPLLRNYVNDVYELADLAYHALVLMEEMDIPLDAVVDELARRHVVDHKVKQERMK